jgi:hypothetical protein
MDMEMIFKNGRLMFLDNHGLGTLLAWVVKTPYKKEDPMKMQKVLGLLSNKSGRPEWLSICCKNPIT